MGVWISSGDGINLMQISNPNYVSGDDLNSDIMLVDHFR
jgi:hypothetical protein